MGKDEILRQAAFLHYGGVEAIAGNIERYEREIEWLTQRNDALEIIERAFKALYAWSHKEAEPKS